MTEKPKTSSGINSSVVVTNQKTSDHRLPKVLCFKLDQRSYRSRANEFVFGFEVHLSSTKRQSVNRLLKDNGSVTIVKVPLRYIVERFVLFNRQGVFEYAAHLGWL